MNKTTGRTVEEKPHPKVPSVDGRNENKLGGVKNLQIALPTLPPVVHDPTGPDLIVRVGVRSEWRLSARPPSRSTHNNK